MKKHKKTFSIFKEIEESEAKHSENSNDIESTFKSVSLTSINNNDMIINNMTKSNEHKRESIINNNQKIIKKEEVAYPK